MDRRAFLIGLGGAGLATPCHAGAEAVISTSSGRFRGRPRPAGTAL